MAADSLSSDMEKMDVQGKRKAHVMPAEWSRAPCTLCIIERVPKFREWFVYFDSEKKDVKVAIWIAAVFWVRSRIEVRHSLKYTE